MENMTKSTCANPALSGIRRKVARALFVLAMAAAAVATVGLLAELFGMGTAAAQLFFFGAALSLVTATAGLTVLPRLERVALGYRPKFPPSLPVVHLPDPPAPAARPLPPAYRPPRHNLA